MTRTIKSGGGSVMSKTFKNARNRIQGLRARFPSASNEATAMRSDLAITRKRKKENKNKQSLVKFNQIQTNGENAKSRIKRKDKLNEIKAMVIDGYKMKADTKIEVIVIMKNGEGDSDNWTESPFLADSRMKIFSTSSDSEDKNEITNLLSNKGITIPSSNV